MYCPKCFDNSLSIADKGVVLISIDGIEKDNGRFLYNNRETKEEMVRDFTAALEEVVKWYSDFKNRPPTSFVQIYTSNFVCYNGCVLPADTCISIIGVLFTRQTVQKILAELGDKYRISIELKEE